jgi:peptide/nickel transport system substrate-binding protein
LDWASDFIPNVKKTYVATSPAHHLVEIPTSTLFLACNNEQGPTANLAVREAISSAINRNLINSAVYDGEYLSTNPMGLILPDFQSLLSPSLKSASVSYDPAKAEQILEAAGYKKGSNGIFALNGTPLSVSVQLIAGYTDYVSIAQILVQELAQVGIQLKIEAESSSAFVSAEDNGTFQMAMIGYGFTPNLYAYYYSIYDSKLAPAIGKAATGDYGRFESPQLDSLLTQVAGLPTAAAGKPLFYKMEAIVASQLPYIPVLQNGSSAEFNGNVVRNFPTAANPYAGPDPWMEPDAGWVAMHMTLAS